MRAATAPLIKNLAWPAALLVLALSTTAMARGGYHHEGESASGPPCGVGAGGLPDPAQTQRCLAQRYQPPKPKPSASPPTSTSPPNATPPTNSTAPSNQGS